MNIRANSTALTTLTRELIARWEQTRETWRDARAEEFERKYIDELIASVDSVAPVIEELGGIVGKLRNDCE